ncbi:MAG: TOBE domain-containing protein, partial [Candidatus Limnocylindria bacterium]
IMPEALWEGGSPPNTMQANVEVVEHMGSKMYVYLGHEGATLTGEFPAEANCNPGQNATVVFDPENLHIFDEATGNALGHSKSAVATPGVGVSV